MSGLNNNQDDRTVGVFWNPVDIVFVFEEMLHHI
jgi:hypothetical protein